MGWCSLQSLMKTACRIVIEIIQRMTTVYSQFRNSHSRGSVRLRVILVTRIMEKYFLSDSI